MVYGMIGCRAQNVLEWMADGQKELLRRENNDPVPRGVLAMTYLDNAFRFYCDVSAAVDTLTAKLSTVPVKAALKNGDWRAAQWLLTRRAPDIFDGKVKADGDHEDEEEKVHIYMPDNGRGPP